MLETSDVGKDVPFYDIERRSEEAPQLDQQDICSDRRSGLATTPARSTTELHLQSAKNVGHCTGEVVWKGRYGSKDWNAERAIGDSHTHESEADCFSACLPRCYNYSVSVGGVGQASTSARDWQFREAFIANSSSS